MALGTGIGPIATPAAGETDPVASADLDQEIIDRTDADAALAAQIATKLPKAGGTMTGTLVLAADPAAPLEAATRQYVLGVRDALVNAAPGTLDTLGELAAQLGNDESAVVALTATVGSKASTVSVNALTARVTAAENVNTAQDATIVTNLAAVPLLAPAVIGRNRIISGADNVRPFTLQRHSATATAPLLAFEDENATTIGSISVAAEAFFAKLAVGAAVVATIGALISPPAAASQGLVVRGVASQTANLQEWQDSASAVKGFVNSAGQIATTRMGLGALSPASPYVMGIQTIATTDVGLLVKGAASQTGDLIQGQNSGGGINFQLTSAGSARFQGSVTTGASLTIGGTSIGASTGSTTNIGVIARGVASQTADLMQWQDSAATVLAYVNAAGNAYHPRLGLGGASPNTTITLTAQAQAVGDTVIVARGTSGQTGDLFDGLNSSATVVFSVGASGQGRFASNLNVGSVAGPAGQLMVTPTAAATIGFVVRGAASQSANLTEWQDSASAVLGYVNSAGGAYHQRLGLGSTGPNSVYTLAVQPTVTTDVGIVSKLVTSGIGDLFQGQNATGTILFSVGASGQGRFQSNLTVGAAAGLGGSYALGVAAGSAANTVIIARAAASQTGNLQEWQDSTTAVLAAVLANGKLLTGTATGVSPVPQLSVNVSSAANVIGAVVKGFASQTANLMEFQDSAGAVKSYINASGQLYVGRAGFGGAAPTVGNTITATAALATDTVMMVFGAASQSANLAEFRDSTSAQMVVISPAGLVRANIFGAIASGKASMGTNADNGGFLILTNGDANKGVAVRGSNATQAADLQQWQLNTGAVLASVTAAGLLGWNAAANVQTTVGAAGAASALPATPTKYLKVVDNTGTTLVIPAYAAA